MCQRKQRKMWKIDNSLRINYKFTVAVPLQWQSAGFKPRAKPLSCAFSKTFYKLVSCVSQHNREFSKTVPLAYMITTCWIKLQSICGQSGGGDQTLKYIHIGLALFQEKIIFIRVFFCQTFMVCSLSGCFEEVPLEWVKSLF